MVSRWNLVRQGFRRHPSESLWYRWQETDGVKNPHWQMVRLPDGTKVSRPVYKIIKGVVMYAHAGWEEGLSPTVETVEVWKYWWIDGCPCHVILLPDGSLQYSVPYQIGSKYSDICTEYAGPCLSPADML